MAIAAVLNRWMDGGKLRRCGRCHGTCRKAQGSHGQWDNDADGMAWREVEGVVWGGCVRRGVAGAGIGGVYEGCVVDEIGSGGECAV